MTREANDNEPMRGFEDKAPAKVPGREAPSLPKRFYTSVATITVERGHSIVLDGRPVRTPQRSQLIVPTEALAAVLADEWQSQGEHIDPATMPASRIVNSTIDAVVPNLSTVRADIVAFAGSDALCYRADEPADLAARQAEAWDPVLAWARDELGAAFKTQVGIVHVEQPTQTLEAIARSVDTLSAFEVAPLHVMTTLTGSAVLALAVAHGRLSAGEAWDAAHIDEDWQIAKWGEDWEAKERRQRRWKDMQAAAQILATLR